MEYTDFFFENGKCVLISINFQDFVIYICVIENLCFGINIDDYLFGIFMQPLNITC